MIINLIKKLPVSLHIIERWYVKFTAYDLRNFSHKGVPFKDSFQVENGKVIHVAERSPSLRRARLYFVDDEKVYPPFLCNYAEYAVMKVQPARPYSTAEMLTFLKVTGKGSDVESTIVLSTLTNLFF
jgi:hypothetical protein